MTLVYSLLHLLVDGICAFAMFGRFLPHGNQTIDFLLYNFCAFALQMPFGIVLDLIEKQKKYCYSAKASRFITVSGVLFTLLGTFTHPIVLGIGNALFHVGGGVGTIHEDYAKHWQGKGLGIFVAPGALGLYLGTLAAKNEIAQYWLWTVSIVMLLCCVITLIKAKNTTCIWQFACNQPTAYNTTCNVPQKNNLLRKTSVLCLALCCLLVVIMRSYIGMTVIFSWKTSIFSGLIAVLAVVFGKMAGGFLAARYGILQTSTVSLFFAAITYFHSASMPFGIAALFLFNITMPITLYLMVHHFPQMPGFSFGFLTFGLFLGFLPAYFELPNIAGGHLIGCVGSALSLLLLYIGIHSLSQ